MQVMSHDLVSPTRPGWMLDEVASAGRENLDADHVARYDSKEDAAAAQEVRVLTQLGLTRDSVVVDIGTGTGQFATAVAPNCARIIAVDVSPLMLTQLRAKVERNQLQNLEVAQAGFLSYEHQGDPADFIYSRYALHHLPDFWKGVALARMRAILRPAGVLRLWDIAYNFDPSDAEERVEAWCATGNSAGAGGWSRAELEEHVRDENSTYTWLLEAMIQRVGFTIEEAEYSGDGIFAKYVLRCRPS